MPVVHIGLGSNLAGPAQQLQQALGELAALPESHLRRHSRLYRSDPLGPAEQPDYVNAVAALETTLAPLALLDALQAIEADHQRVRGERWGPRTLDLDLLLYAEQRLDLPRLQVPHPGLPLRNFVLYPLFEIDPQLTIPGHGPLATLLKQCPRGTLQALEMPTEPLV